MCTDIFEGKINLHGKYWCRQTWKSCVEAGQAAWAPSARVGGHDSHCHKQTDPQTSLHCLHTINQQLPCITLAHASLMQQGMHGRLWRYQAETLAMQG